LCRQLYSVEDKGKRIVDRSGTLVLDFIYSIAH
jgi:hypothetical protein